MLPSLINKLKQGKNLTYHECYNVVNDLTSQDHAEISEFLILLHKKPETVDELKGFVDALKDKMINVESDLNCLDIAGTGGDKSSSVNISTAACLVTASLGVATAKHGNRSVSSQCGSADILESLGININLNINQVHESLKENNFAFLFAPNFHPTFQQYKTLRKSIGAPTTFNLLGPVINPIQPQYLVIGVYNTQLLNLYADFLVNSKIQRGLVVHSCGLDEITLLGPTQVVEVNGETKKEYVINPKDYGFAYCELSDIQGGDINLNKKLLLDCLSGERGPIQDTVILNAAAGLYASFAAPTFQEAIVVAREQIQNGRTLDFLRQLLQYQVSYA